MLTNRGSSRHRERMLRVGLIVIWAVLACSALHRVLRAPERLWLDYALLEHVAGIVIVGIAIVLWLRRRPARPHPARTAFYRAP